MNETSSDTATGAETGAGDPPIRRQAVVVVHGQGEQRPMGTIRDFVGTLWAFDFSLKLADERLHDTVEGNRCWIVPDDKGGLYDLQRITCPELSDGRRTDFFELYYADILSSTPLRTLWRWLERLLWIDPRDVTVRMRWPWSVFWVAALVAAILTGAVLLSARHIFEFDWAGVLVAPANQPGLFVAIGAIVVLVLPRLTPLALFLTAIPPWLAGVVSFIGVAMIFWRYPTFWYLSGLGFEIFLGLRFLLPYFGDAASYLSAHTETVESRQRVRLRGLQLLTRLHNDPDYDRVIVIGHSLGSVLAYDLLHILWTQLGPVNHNPPTEEAAEALAEVDRFVDAHPEPVWAAETVAAYQDLQWRAYSRLRQQKPQDGAEARAGAGWKISDFITLGTPLTSAQFIVADGHEDFERLKSDRVMPMAPAKPYNVEFQTLYHDRKGQAAAHHGAVFSTVRWTNIFDPFHPFAFIYGDAVGGPVSGPDLFGAGVRDEPTRIHRFERLVREGEKVRHEGRWPPISRISTHNYYWTNTSGDWRYPSAHIAALRAAVGVDRKVPSRAAGT